MTIKNKNLLLVDYQLDNIQNIQQIKLDDTEMMMVIDFNSIEINNSYDNIGLLVQNPLSININNIKKIINQNVEFINEANYNTYLNIDFNYESNNININYNDSYTLLLKNFTVYGGIFYLSNNFLKCFINNENGTINISQNDVGEYIFFVNYNIFSLNIQKKITVNVLPIINYNDVYTIYDNTMYISPIPTAYPENLNGVFSVESDNLPISINSYNGSFIIQNLSFGNYDFNIKYTVNNISFNKQIKINVLSIVTYSKLFYEFKFNEPLNIDVPVINDTKYLGGTFTINDETKTFNVNKDTGKIFVNQNVSLNTEIYNLNINYTVNNSSFDIKIQISIIPYIKYNINDLFENKSILIDKPTIKSKSKITFSLDCDKKNIFINKNTGSITLNNFEAGTFNIPINVKYNNNSYLFHLPIVVLPYINFENDINITYADDYKINFEHFKSMGQIIIKNNDENIDEIKLNPGKYNLDIYYTKESLTINKQLNITVAPKVEYKINDKYFVNEPIQLEVLENSHNGTFSYNDNENITIDKLSGLIVVNNPTSKEYLINYLYKYDNITYNKEIKFTVYSSILYEKDITLSFGDNNIINKPDVNPIGGVFSIDKQSNNKNFKINTDGSISINKNVGVGSYFIFVNYTINRITTQVPINLTITPHVNYNTEFYFDKNLVSTIKPNSILHNNINFKIKNNYNNLFSITNQGEIMINNNINIGLYKLEIIATISNISVTKLISIFVSPNVIYNDVNHNINYGSEYIINEPEIIDKGGDFFTDNDKIYVNKLTGLITISNTLLPGNYNFNVIYKLNDSVKNILFNFNVYPLLKYNDINIEYNKKFKSEKPQFSPEGGIFTSIYDKNVIIDNNTGVLIFSQDIGIGTYNIPVKYVINNIFTEFNCCYNVLPVINYEKEYNFNNNNFKIKPQKINPKGGIFKLDNENFSINNSGEIKLINQTIGTTILNIEYENILKVNKEIKITVIPDFYFNNITISYKENINVQPTINIDKGVFNLLNHNDILNIDNLGNITNSKMLDVGNYDIKIEYIIDDNKVNKSFSICVLPTININDKFTVLSENLNMNIIAEPKNGIFQINNNNNNFIIDETTGIISFNQQTPLGLHNIDLVYTFNNVSVNKKITVNKKLSLTYDTNNIIIKGIETTYNPIVNFLGGIYKINKNKNKNINIDENTGIILVNKNISFGNYTCEIEYNVLDYKTTFLFEFNVLAPFNYKASVYNLTYGEHVRIEPNINTDSSEFSISPEINGVDVSKDNGIIHVHNLDVGSYNFIINCFSFDQLLNTNVKINILPVIKYSESVINIKYGTIYQSKIPQLYPNNGIFYTESNFINLNEDGSFIVNSNIDVNVYYIDIIYEVNGLKSNNTIKLIINPVFEYKHSEISFDYGNDYYTDMPTYYPKDGIFSIVNQPKGIDIQKNGIIHINNNLHIGSYDLSILYKINKINLTNTINIKILPQFYYKTIDLTQFNKYFIGYYKNKNIKFENFNDIFQHNKLINTSKPIIIQKGYFCILNSIPDVNINGDNGSIIIKNSNIGVYSFNVNYNFLNVNKSYNYQVLITPSINYDNNKYNNKFQEKLIIKAPTVYPEGGVFYFPETYNFFTINNQTGEITCNDNPDINIYNIIVMYEINEYISCVDLEVTIYPNTYIDNFKTTNTGKNKLNIQNYYEGLLITDYEINYNSIEVFTDKIGIHNFNLTAIYKNITFPINFTVEINPKIYYESDVYYVEYGKTYIIGKPTIENNSDSGFFDITNKIKGITIDKVSGEIYVFDKLNVKNYPVNIEYTLNNIVTQITLNVIIKPIINYINTKYEFNYGTLIKTEIPICSPANGLFTCNDHNVVFNNQGDIYLNDDSVGFYNFTIIYTVNEIDTTMDMTILIKPTITYDTDYYVDYGSEMIIYPQKLSPPSYIVKANNLPLNILLDETSGNISVLDSCVPNIYTIELLYVVNHVETTTKINIHVDPFLNKNYTVTTIYGSNETFNLHNNAFNLLYNITTKTDKSKLFIKDSKLNTYNLDIDTYNLKINYKINKIFNEISYSIVVIPNLTYSLENIFSFGSKVIISPIVYSPTNGSFKLINDFFVIDKYGCITQKQNIILNINTYNLSVEYTVNKIKKTVNLQVQIKPLLEFNNTIYEGFFNETLTINPSNYSPKKLNFSIEPYGTINSHGNIQITDLEIGKYQVKVNYDLTSVLLDIIIKPVFFYSDNNNILNFGVNKNYVPSVSKNIGRFYFKEEINGFIIDENTGIIKVINLLPNLYNINVYYLCNDIEVNTVLNITVIPLLKYNNNNLLIKYKSESSTIIPTFNPVGGTFSTDTKLLHNNIYLDESTGQLTIDDTNIGNYNFNVNYSYNKQIVSYNILFTVTPVVLYDLCKFTFYRGIENNINKPYVNPSYGTFSLVADSYLTKYITVNNNGSIKISENINIGSFDFSVIYEYNKIQFSTSFSINIYPFILYDNVNIEFQNNTFIHKPVFSSSNNGLYDFTIDTYDLIINNDGSITNFNCLNVGVYKIYINYKHLNNNYKTYFLCQINPIIVPNFNNNSIYLYPNNGKLDYNNKYFTIKQNNIIHKNIYDNVIIPITYTVNNVSKKVIIQYLSKPIKVFDSEIFIVYGTDKIINSYVSTGIISSENKPKSLKIEELSLNIEYLDVGIYNFTINYLVNNLTFTQPIKLTISPKFFYKNKYFEINSDLGSINEEPIMEPSNGNLSLKQYIKNIGINNSGIVNSFNSSPGIYNITAQYSVNNILSSDNITVCCKPSFILQNNMYSVKYGDVFLVNNFKCQPNNGVFTSSIHITTQSKTEITFDYLENLNIGIHNIFIDYTVNNVTTRSNITLNIEPTIIYPNKNYKTTYGQSITIGAPNLSHINGTFNLDIKSENNFTGDDFEFLFDGSINVSSKLEIGSYILYISYYVDKYTVTDIITLVVDPYLFYDDNIFTIIYNKDQPRIHINAPNFYPNGGMFYIDTNSQNVKINKNNGIIELDELNIGKYTFNVFYKFKKNILKSNITINMNPYINYNLSVVNIKYKTLYIINYPETSNTGGTFSSKNLPRGAIINSRTGIITINQREFVDIGFYNVIINYTINNLTTSANIYINITP